MRWSFLVGLVLVPLMAGADTPGAATQIATGAAHSVDAGERDWIWWLDNEYYKVNLDVRPRAEFAEQEGRDFAQAWTTRTRLGIGNKPWHGLAAYVEGEGTFTFDRSRYWDRVSSDNGKTVVADPEFIELNQAWLQYANEEFAGVSAKAGRQRIKLDDDRFIGNVGWRQNEQTFDAVRGGTSFGVEDLQLEYAYAWKVQRIFADKGGPGTSDWDSENHMIRLHYGGLDWLKVSVFSYLLDFKNDSPGNSSNSYGFRATGSVPLGDDWNIGYVGSYAFQTDAAKNAVDYDAHYGWASADIGYLPLGSVGTGYEFLGSDDGKHQFVTPLATAHKFNGFADVFLTNGGPNGLQDFFVYVAPKLPWKVKGRLIYHHFWSDEGGDELGEEFDLVFQRPFGDYTTVLMKGAWFWADSGASAPADIYRVTLEATFKF
jgi:hypothetical protein